MSRLISTAADSPHVIALHGWGLSGFATSYWRSRLRRAGFVASSFAYRSRTRSLDQNVAQLADHVRALPGQGPVHLVGHSLGGLVILHGIAHHRFERLGRVVLAGTPYQGSAPASRLKSNRPGKWLLGKTLGQWRGIDFRDLPAGLELGTIAGTAPLGIGRLLSRLETPHDGTVSVKETHVPFATERLVLHLTHTEMLMSPAVVAQMVSFLRTGKFQRP